MPMLDSIPANSNLRRPTRALRKDYDFEATQLISDGERSIDVVHFNGHMAVMCEDGPVLISREQARDFFCFD